MTTIEVMRKALEALEPRCGTNADERGPDGAITALRAELKRLEAVEPVAWGRMYEGELCDIICPSEHAREPGSYTVPLYTAPIATSIPELTLAEVDHLGDRELAAANWAYALAAERAGATVKGEKE